MDSHFRKVAGWTTTLTLLALVVGCSPSQPPQESSPGSGNSSQETSSNPSAQPLPKSTHSIGEVVSVQNKRLNLDFTVNGIREHKGKGVLKPNNGNQWILVNTTIANKGQEPKTLSIASFGLIDDKNNQYEVALLAGALEDVESPTGQLKPGAQQQGEVAFEVPTGAKGLKLLFKPNNSDCQAVAAKPKASETLNCEPIVIKLDK